MNLPPCHQEPTWTIDRGLFEPSDHFGNSGSVSSECRPKSLVTLKPESRKGLLRVKFRYFGVRHTRNSDDKESGPSALKSPKSRNTKYP
jgi:hypothetical protein